MPASKTLTATPFVEFRPDSYTETEKAEGASWPLGGGFYDFGFEVNGAKFVLASLHGGAVEKQFAAAEAAKSAEPTVK
jgi:hypothetical protein